MENIVKFNNNLTENQILNLNHLTNNITIDNNKTNINLNNEITKELFNNISNNIINNQILTNNLSTIKNYSILLYQTKIELNTTIIHYNIVGSANLLNKTKEQIDLENYEDFKLWGTIYIIIVTLILTGNLLTVVAVNFGRKLAQNVSNQFVFNLGLADLSIGLVLLYYVFFYSMPMLQTNFTCLTKFFLMSIAIHVSTTAVLVIAIDRYIAIVYPLHYNRFMTKTIARRIIIFEWCWSIIEAAWQIFGNSIDNSYYSTNLRFIESCSFRYVVPRNYVKFGVIPFFVLVWLALFIMYMRIWKEAVGHTKRLRNSANYCRNKENSNSDYKSIQVVVMVLGCFTVCWIPYLIIILLQVTYLFRHLDPHQQFYRAAFTLGMCNSFLNPIIYAWKNAAFRKAFIRMLHCQSPNERKQLNSFNWNGRVSVTSEHCFKLRTIKPQDTYLKHSKDHQTTNKETTNHEINNFRKIRKNTECSIIISPNSSVIIKTNKQNDNNVSLDIEKN